jgi:hypothetical protein
MKPGRLWKVGLKTQPSERRMLGKGRFFGARTADRLGNHFEGSFYLRLLFRYSFGSAATWPCGLALTFLRHCRIEFTA